MRILLSTLILVLLLPGSGHSTLHDGPDPVTMNVSGARISGKTVQVPVSNNSTSPITAVVTAQYDDGNQVHTAEVTVPLAAKGSAIVGVELHTITDDINPMARIIEDADPVEFAIALGAALWVD